MYVLRAQMHMPRAPMHARRPPLFLPTRSSARATPIPMVCELLCFVYAGTTTTLPANLAPANPGGLPWDCTDTAAFITYNEAPPQDISVSLTGASTPACPEP